MWEAAFGTYRGKTLESSTFFVILEEKALTDKILQAHIANIHKMHLQKNKRTGRKKHAKNSYCSVRTTNAFIELIGKGFHQRRVLRLLSKGVEMPFLELAAEWEAAQPRNLHLFPLAKMFEEEDREDGVAINDEGNRDEEC